MQKILFIDAYDSFSNNIVALLQTHLAVATEKIFIDDSRFVLNDDAFLEFLRQFDAVVAGPGPGHPGNSQDTGLINKLWSLSAQNLLPVLGICLGFQSLCLAFGAEVTRLEQPRHGMITEITHRESDLFARTGRIVATQYHSLRVATPSLARDGASGNLWKSPEPCSPLLPLAWDLSDDLNGAILMAARHRTLPFWGVQFHPESICTSDEGRHLVQNWWHRASEWNTGRKTTVLHSQFQNGHASPTNGLSGRTHHTNGTTNGSLAERKVMWRKIKLPCHSSTADIVELVRGCRMSFEPILLESGLRNGKPVNPETGRFSIIGMQDSTSTQIRYSTAGRTLVVTGTERLETRQCPVSHVYEYLASLMKKFAATGGHSSVPFWGGPVGYFSYEASLEGIGLALRNAQMDRPDIWFVLVERSIVIDHAAGAVYLQTIKPDDARWLDDLERLLLNQNSALPSHSYGKANGLLQQQASIVSAPSKSNYCEKVRQCHEHLRAGSSYELCLTDQTLVHSPIQPWALYRRLRQLNPAPFGAYLSFTAGEGPERSTAQDLNVVSSSPERFLSWTREGQCQFRPIKGTLKKSEGVDRAMAKKVLGSPKEQAENLMIVDLIRHDLNGVARPGTVHVPKLMTIEEYETVFQLVSVIEGDLAAGQSGLSALAASLPPGSMTGAPKKRSCELLQQLEGASSTRGLYSGVMGYLDVGGGGDFSVVIRTAFKWQDEDIWRVGAGGAITILSEEEAEYEEMSAKRESLLKAFGIAAQ